MLKRTRLGLQRALVVQYDALLLSALAFEAGYMGEAVRIANAIFLLLGRGMRTHASIIDQLGEKIDIATTVQTESHSPLIGIELMVIDNKDGHSAEYMISPRPRGRAATFTGRNLAIDDWWKEIVLRNHECSLNRNTLVRVLRDQDGGAHFDETLTDPNYTIALTKGIAFFVDQPDGTRKGVTQLLETTVRQIGEEVLRTLQPAKIRAERALSQAIEAGEEKLVEEL